MQVNLDEETVQFILSEAELQGWNRQTVIVEDFVYLFNEDPDDEDNDSHNLTEILYRIYTKHRDQFKQLED